MSKEIKFIDQSINDLKLNLVKKLNNFDLNIISKQNKQFILNSLTINIEASIIGASHSITIKDNNNNEIFTEVLANLDLSSNKDLIYMSNLYDIDEYKYSFTEDMLYEFKKNEFDFNSEELELFEYNIQSKKNILDDYIYLQYKFPSQNNNDEKEYCSSTIVFVYVEENTIYIKSIHYYANEKKALISKSYILNIKENNDKN